MKKLVTVIAAALAVAAFAPLYASAVEGCGDLRQPDNACVRSWRCNGADHAWWPAKVAPAGTKCTTFDGHKGECSGKSLDDASPVCKLLEFSIGGKVVGLKGGTVSLEDNSSGGSEQSVSGTGTVSFTFKQQVESGYRYDIKVIESPSGETCTPESPHNIGVVEGDVKDVVVKCKKNNKS